MEIANVILLCAKYILQLYTIITWPIYYLIQQPWKSKENQQKVRAVPVARGDDYVTFRSAAEMSDVHARFLQDNIDTLEKVFRFAVRQHGHRAAVGVRQILSEEDEIQPNGRVFKKFDLGEYQWRTFSQMDSEAESFGRGLRELGLRPRENIVIFAETRAEWLTSAFGAMKQNITLVTLYATLGDDALIHGINETEVSCVITTQELAPKFKTVLACTPGVTLLIVIEDQHRPFDCSGYRDSVKVLPYREVVRLGEMSSLSGKRPTADDIAIIMYTSGSTGTPKGVLMSHSNIIASLLAYTNVATIYENDVYMAYLPLAHVLELTAECMCMLYGIPIGYSTPLTMTDQSSKVKRGCKGDASILRPTIIASVPLILDRIYKSITEKIEAGTPFSKGLFNLLLDYKLYWFKQGYNTPLINATIFRRVKALLGGRVRFILTGGAPLAPETHDFVRATLCCPILQGYGLTETCAATSIMDNEDRSTGRVGGPLTCCDIKLVNWEEGNYRVTDAPNPRGEIHVGGDNIVVGYYKQEEKTREDFYEDEGRKWFRTGDIGEIHPDGALKIIDRKKDLVKLQFGEYVSLGKVEAELKTCALVDNVCVYADSTKHFVVALLVPTPHALKDLASKTGRLTDSLPDLCVDPEMEKAVLKEIQNHSKKCRLEKFEIPQAVKLIPDMWTPDMGLVTAAFKLKRKEIQNRYQKLIDRMYS